MSSEMTQAHAPHRDYEGGKIGMWLFLFTELLLFGGLFVIYGVYRIMHSGEFSEAAEQLNVTMGVANTFVLLTSSWTMVMAVSAIQRGQKGKCIKMLWLTIACALIFMVIKYFEWSAKFHHGIWPGSEEVLALGHGQTLFFSLYFCMTGLHGFHVVVGVVAMLFVLPKVSSGELSEKRFGFVENLGLYWHLVDLIWIFLLPLFYLTT